MEELCGQIAVEKDPHKFLDLVKQLNDLLEQSQHQLDVSRASSDKPKTQST